MAVGFGLRHQAVADKEEGLPIDYVDPTEGNFSLTESVAVLDKDNGDKADKAMEMAQCIIEKEEKNFRKHTRLLYMKERQIPTTNLLIQRYSRKN